MKERAQKFLRNILSPGRSEDRQQKVAESFKNRGGAKPCRLGPADRKDVLEALLGPDDPENLLHPLWPTKGIQFPYQPDVTFGGSAEYQDFHFTHSNYPHYQYAKSMPQEIQISGPFTCQTNNEGRYLVATLQFLRAMSMNEFGTQARDKGIAGTPPPVLRFNYLGEYMFSNVPVVITNFAYTLPRDVDYVGIQYNTRALFGGELRVAENADMWYGGKGGKGTALNGRMPVIGGPSRPITYVPTKMELTVTLKVQHNTRRIRQEFDVDKFKTGILAKKGFV